jgi:hypothetical protein
MKKTTWIIQSISGSNLIIITCKLDIKLFSLLAQVIHYEDDQIVQYEWAEHTTRLKEIKIHTRR